jgi:uncharacterized Zn finger protein
MSPITPRVQDNVLLRMAALLVAQEPTARDRIVRALHLVGQGHVRQERWGSGEWFVRSSDGRHTYLVRDHFCTCPDATNRERICKHQYAVLLLTAWEHESRFLAQQAAALIEHALIVAVR